MRKIALFAAIVAASVSTPVFAGQGFVRGEVGQAHLKTAGSSGKGNQTAFSIRGGYFFNANVGVEGFYADYDRDNSAGVNARLNGFGAGVVVKKNFEAPQQGFYIGGRGGLAQNRVAVNVTGLGSLSTSSTQPYIGVGAGYDFNPNMGVGLNWDFTKASLKGVNTVNMDVQTFSLDFEYRF